LPLTAHRLPLTAHERLQPLTVFNKWRREAADKWQRTPRSGWQL